MMQHEQKIDERKWVNEKWVYDFIKNSLLQIVSLFIFAIHQKSEQE